VFKCSDFSFQVFRRRAGWLCALWLAAGSVVASPQAEFGDKFLMMGTGPVGGAFRPIGETVCEAVNEDRRASLVRCVPVGTAGSIFNLYAVANGSIQLGVAQEDLVSALYADRKQTLGRSLRVVARLHDSPIAVMVHQASGITELSQIAGKNFNLGNPGSGMCTITGALLRALDLRKEDFASTANLPTSEFERAFCDRKVDVVVEAVAHPSALFEKLRACGGVFIDIPAPVRSKMQAANKLLSPMAIAADTYAAQYKAVTTLGMRNVLITNAAVDEESIFRLTTTLRRQHEEIKASQLLLSSMTRVEQIDLASLPAPLHPGALRALQGNNGRGGLR
jgi:TRAP transporter TAXI family solute receptor